MHIVHAPKPAIHLWMCIRRLIPICRSSYFAAVLPRNLVGGTGVHTQCVRVRPGTPLDFGRGRWLDLDRGIVTAPPALHAALLGAIRDLGAGS